MQRAVKEQPFLYGVKMNNPEMMDVFPLSEIIKMSLRHPSFNKQFEIELL